MATELRRMTFAVTPDMEPVMDRAKQLFYDRTQSDMIRTLIVAGLDAMEDKGQTEQTRKQPENTQRNT